MGQTPREIVRRCLRFETPERMPREMWVLPWWDIHDPAAVKVIRDRYPDDVVWPPNVFRPSSVSRGDAYKLGEFIDEWGCRFVNIQEGVHGEVKDPILKDLSDVSVVRPPHELFPEDWRAAQDSTSRFCAGTDRFVVVGTPRPWERYQFLRGSVNALMDVMDPDAGMRRVLRIIHEYSLKFIEFWAGTDVDAISFMDDWGSQRQLLIPPAVWRDLFKPLYREYVDAIHAAGKFALMHSDGCIQEIYPDLVEIGLDAVNSQLFVMDIPALARVAKGRLTFWGEMDRQHVLPARDPQVGRDAVRKVARHLYDPRGGVWAQFELTPGSNPAVAMAIYDEWDKVQADWKAGAKP
jgi:hypothetical protein